MLALYRFTDHSEKHSLSIILCVNDCNFYGLIVKKLSITYKTYKTKCVIFF